MLTLAPREKNNTRAANGMGVHGQLFSIRSPPMGGVVCADDRRHCCIAAYLWAGAKQRQAMATHEPSKAISLKWVALGVFLILLVLSIVRGGRLRLGLGQGGVGGKIP